MHRGGWCVGVTVAPSHPSCTMVAVCKYARGHNHHTNEPQRVQEGWRGGWCVHLPSLEDKKKRKSLFILRSSSVTCVQTVQKPRTWPRFNLFCISLWPDWSWYLWAQVWHKYHYSDYCYYEFCRRKNNIGLGVGAEVAWRQGAITAPNHQIGLIYDLCRAPWDNTLGGRVL